MKLIDLDPHWVGIDGKRIGISFDCPCCLKTDRSTRLVIYWEQPSTIQTLGYNYISQYIWKRSGDDFANITFSPSIDASNHGHWHGFITNGEIK